jgi:hypothetical protein
MSLAVIAQGTLFKIALVGASIGSAVTIPECMKIGAPNSKFDLLDVTSHDSTGGFKEYIPGLIDGENATAEVNFVPTNAVHIGIRTDALTRTKDNFDIIFPVPSAGSPGVGSTLTFAAYIVGWPAVADAGAVLKNTMTAKVTGLQTWS